jgi:CRISPR/Cas system endoribonuclease Cas6 (RAMP superfamily)
MINTNIARCIAKISGDGNIYLGNKSNNGYIRYSNKCKFLREEFKKDMHFLFGKIPLTGFSGSILLEILSYLE